MDGARVSRPITDAELLVQLTTVHRERLTDSQREAFDGMEEQGYPLTNAQLAWIHGVAERLGVQVAPSENLFSNMDPEKQARQREAAKRIDRKSVV